MNHVRGMLHLKAVAEADRRRVRTVRLLEDVKVGNNGYTFQATFRGCSVLDNTHI